ncbi:MAG: hypothetical protein LBF97_05340, partial [Elusimicrobiota bacterium]|nr:hypothetical protein [Elusimicrobiota bacterium]
MLIYIFLIDRSFKKTNNSLSLDTTDYYNLFCNNCVDFCQNVYITAGKIGNFTELFTKEELSQIDNAKIEGIGAGT